VVVLVGPLLESEKGNSYMHYDYFSRWMEVIPIPNQEICGVAGRLADKFLCSFLCQSKIREGSLNHNY